MVPPNDFVMLVSLCRCSNQPPYSSSSRRLSAICRHICADSRHIEARRAGNIDLHHQLSHLRSGIQKYNFESGVGSGGHPLPLAGVLTLIMFKISGESETWHENRRIGGIILTALFRRRPDHHRSFHLGCLSRHLHRTADRQGDGGCSFKPSTLANYVKVSRKFNFLLTINSLVVAV